MANIFLKEILGLLVESPQFYIRVLGDVFCLSVQHVYKQKILGDQNMFHKESFYHNLVMNESKKGADNTKKPH